MKAAARKTSRVPALALVAALAAQSAWADGEPVMPFPGRSIPDTAAGDTRAAEGRATVPETVPEGSMGRVPGAATAEAAMQVPGGAAAAPPSGRANQDQREGDVQADAPAGGSRLLRALAGASATNRTALEEAVTGSAGSAPLYAAEGCPRGLLRRLLAGAADDAGALTALGLEREILTLCRERQEVVAGLFEIEARLRDLRAPPVPVPPSAEAVQTPAPAAPEGSTGRQAEASPLRAALAGAAEKTNEADTRAEEPRAKDPRAGSPRAADTRAGDTRAAEPQGNVPEQAARYAWFSIIGTAGALRAGVTDGSGVWFVREGDALPGGAAVTEIAARPPAVRIREAGETAEEAPLPYLARPGGGP